MSNNNNNNNFNRRHHHPSGWNGIYYSGGSTAAAGGASFKPKKAKCADNQRLVDALALKRSKTKPNSQFVHTLRKAETSIAGLKEPIHSYKDALAVKGIGPKLAHILFPNDIGGGTNRLSQESSPGGSASVASSSAHSCNTSTTAGKKAATTRKRKKMASKTTSSSEDAVSAKRAAYERAASRAEQIWKESGEHRLSGNSSTGQGPGVWGGGGGGSAGNYAAASVAAASASSATATTDAEAIVKRRNLLWRVVLVVDNRERHQEHVRGKCEMAGIPCDVRPLPIGDMTWIAQGIVPPHSSSSPTNKNANASNAIGDDDDASSKQQQKKKAAGGGKNCSSSTTPGSVACELLLGTVIERKTLADLESSIHGTRYAEQRLRMKESGLFQLLLLVEGDMVKKGISEKKDARLEKCHTAIWETRLHLGFNAVQTSNIDETVATLKRLHRRILQRTFPEASDDQTLPAFAEPDASGDHRRRVNNGGRRSSVSEASNDSNDDGIRRPRPRRRRRLESLMTMTFDTPPTAPPGCDRLMTYEELKAKIEYDREKSQKRIGNIHAAMLKQVGAVKGKKVAAIVEQYPTPNALMSAYKDSAQQLEGGGCATATEAKAMLLSELHTQDPDVSARKCTVGNISSKNVYVAYGMSFRDSNGNNQQQQCTDAEAVGASNHSSLTREAISSGNHHTLSQSSVASTTGVDATMGGSVAGGDTASAATDHVDLPPRRRPLSSVSAARKKPPPQSSTATKGAAACALAAESSPDDNNWEKQLSPVLEEDDSRRSSSGGATLLKKPPPSSSSVPQHEKRQPRQNQKDEVVCLLDLNTTDEDKTPMKPAAARPRGSVTAGNDPSNTISNAAASAQKTALPASGREATASSAATTAACLAGSTGESSSFDSKHGADTAAMDGVGAGDDVGGSVAFPPPCWTCSQCTYVNSPPFPTLSRRRVCEMCDHAATDTETDDAVAHSPKGKCCSTTSSAVAALAPSPAGCWRCSQCTFINSPPLSRRRVCEMCDHDATSDTDDAAAQHRPKENCCGNATSNAGAANSVGTARADDTKRQAWKNRAATSGAAATIASKPCKATSAGRRDGGDDDSASSSDDDEDLFGKSRLGSVNAVSRTASGRTKAGASKTKKPSDDRDRSSKIELHSDDSSSSSNDDDVDALLFGVDVPSGAPTAAAEKPKKKKKPRPSTEVIEID